MQQQVVWRKQLKNIFQELQTCWLPDGLKGTGLKTDLYDEATYSDWVLGPFVPQNTPCIGIDLSFNTAQAAQRRMKTRNVTEHRVVLNDVRCLSFHSQFFNYVLSHSSIDHFENKEDISLAIGEMYRVLKPGGLLMITLDNPHNPVVMIRNLIPLSMLQFLKIVPYQVGRTIPSEELRGILKEEGFKISKDSFIDHGPRFLTIKLCKWFEKNNSALDQYMKVLRFFEKMAHWPTSHLSGYFYAVLCTKEDKE